MPSAEKSQAQLSVYRSRKSPTSLTIHFAYGNRPVQHPSRKRAKGTRIVSIRGTQFCPSPNFPCEISCAAANSGHKLQDDQLDSILDAIARGQSGAFMQIVRAHGLMLQSYIGAQIFNAGDVED